ncbi:Signal peptidase I V [Aquisphaera giovannonii]|uniref:Signal peptidase I n=1 Tax=Aquisphaera giovannonii TaxID=406548 RepID=A0A5B9WBK6_9BACT|nr:signal peptidase I [Aquisphaera giovannonii]QEH37654.1 Signal peptidase I V [Aquisphaera giovannonii]
MTQPGPQTGNRWRENPASGVVRQTMDLIVMLCLGVLLFRTFSAEAYVVPTGSMAPTLLGHHRELICPNCRYTFVIGLDEEGRQPRAVCPNCGKDGLERLDAVECNGDRVLVQKFLFDFRAPRRWEVAVFHFPGDPSQAYVKRVVGLPGESVQVRDGDVYVDGRIARKTPEELQAMQILVHDCRYVPDDSDRYPRWDFLRGWPRRPLPTGWRRDGTGFVHDPIARIPGAYEPEDWLQYHHWDPVLGRYGPIRDHYPYNGGDLAADNVIADLAVEAVMEVGADVESLSIRLRSGGDRFVVRIPVNGRGADRPSLQVARNGRRVAVRPLLDPFEVVDSGPWPRAIRLEASAVDHRLRVAIDGRPLFEPIDYDDPASGPPPDESPFGLGVRGGSVAVRDLKIFRDVYYTSTLGGIPRHPHGVSEPCRLGPDEFFVLGDNSPVSSDSRFWGGSPVVPRSMFLGKPFLVHLPGQVVALEVFGRSVYWVPDPRRIRYIH